MSKFARLFSIIVMLIFTHITMSAESTLTIFFPAYINDKYTLTINGQQVEGMEFPIRKVNNTLNKQTPIVYYQKSFKQIHFNKNGKYLVIVKMEYTNPNNANVTTYQAEYQIILESGDEIFLEVESKSFSDMKITEIDSKKAGKYINSGKYHRLSDENL